MIGLFKFGIQIAYIHSKYHVRYTLKEIIMKSYLFVLLSLVFCSCSTTTVTRKDNRDKVYVLFKNVFLEQKELDNLFLGYKQAAKENGNVDAVEVVQKILLADTYNKDIVKYARKKKGYKAFEKQYYKFIDNSLLRKLELLRVKKVNQSDFEKYIEDFNMIENAPERLEEIDKLVEGDFPSHNSEKFISKIAVMMAKTDKSNLRKSIYQNTLSNVKLVTLKLNLYLFQKVPLNYLKEVTSLQQSDEYKKSRMFIEDVQKQVNEKYIDLIKKELEKSGMSKFNFPEYE